MSGMTDVLVGGWAGMVIYGPKAEEFTVTFDDDGTATLVSDGTTGQGNWSVTGPGTFDFSIKEKLNFGDSGVSGDAVVTGIDHLVISISASMSGTSFEGTGIARVYDGAGTEIFAIDARVSARQLAVN